MEPHVRPMVLAETDLIIDYFHTATPEHLELMGVDPSRLPTRSGWRAHCEHQYSLPIEQRSHMMLLWQLDGAPVGFSTTNPTVYGDRANMHLHVFAPAQRKTGIGVACVRQSVEIYFETLKLKRLYCEPNAYNVAPNRTVQKAGFKYIKTHKTVPGGINYHQ